MEKLLLMSYRISAVVAPVIQSSSPEGLIPMDTDSESASRLQVILNEIQPRDTNEYFNQAKILKECDSLDLGDLDASVSNIDISAEIKGSFRLSVFAVSSGFFCKALLASEPKKGKMDLLKITMKEFISLAVPTVDSQNSVPQVHALNVLRALFRDTRLGESIIPYVADGAKAAILGFTSPVWAVRNSSTLLFSSLITRIFGVQRGKDELSKTNRMTGREFFSRFPELYPFLLKQLEAVAHAVDSDRGEPDRHTSMFLLLLVLERLYPSPMDGTSSALSMAPFVPFIVSMSAYTKARVGTGALKGLVCLSLPRCGRSPIYRSREMAARALVPFVMADQVPSTIQTLLATLPKSTDQCFRQNHIHGTLLQVFHLLRAYTDSKYGMKVDFKQTLADITAWTRARLWLATRQNPCLVTRAVYIDILSLLTRCLDAPTKGNQPVLEHLGFWEDIRGIISRSELVTGFPHASKVPGLSQYLQSLTKLTLTCMWAEPATEGEQARDLPITAPHLLWSSFLEVRTLTLGALLERFTAVAPQLAKKSLPLSLRGLSAELLRLAMKESHPECFCQVLKILHCMDPQEWLPFTEQYVQLTPKDFLVWIMDIASSDRSEIQGVALRLSSSVLAYRMQTPEEVSLILCLLWGEGFVLCLPGRYQ
ncbi:tRNA (32-2'-O)-methyltransferase regulator THADA-like [Ctenodactylus gundi]